MAPPRSIMQSIGEAILATITPACRSIHEQGKRFVDIATIESHGDWDTWRQITYTSLDLLQKWLDRYKGLRIYIRKHRTKTGMASLVFTSAKKRFK